MVKPTKGLLSIGTIAALGVLAACGTSSTTTSSSGAALVKEEPDTLQLFERKLIDAGVLDPARLAHAKALLPADLAPSFDQLIGAARLGLAATLHDLFLIAAIVATVALIATVFMREVPLTRTAERTVEEEEVAA